MLCYNKPRTYGKYLMKTIIHSQVVKGPVRDVKMSEPVIFVDNEARGRAGHSDPATNRSLVIYTSCDDLHWDDGLVLGDNERECSFYSENLTVTMPNGKQRMYAKYSEGCHLYSGPERKRRWQVNNMLTYFESI